MAGEMPEVTITATPAGQVQMTLGHGAPLTLERHLLQTVNEWLAKQPGALKADDKGLLAVEQFCVNELRRLVEQGRLRRGAMYERVWVFLPESEAGKGNE